MKDTIAEVFDMQPVEVVHTDGTPTVIPPDGVEEDVDFDFVRANHYLLAQKASEALELAMRVAKGSEHPNAIKELGNVLKVASEVNRQLLLLSKDKADTKAAKKTPAAQQTSVTNVKQQVVFTGSSSDINKILSEK